MIEFALCFVPLFVAVDAVGVLPLFINLTDGLEPSRARRVVIQSVLTAGGVGVAFLLAGPWLLRMLGVAVADFKVAGGVLLFVLSLRDMLAADKTARSTDPESLGSVPIGVPLITGPAVLTTSVLLLSRHGYALTLASLLVNVLLAGLVFWFATPLRRFLGTAGTKTLSKIAGLLLAAIGVMMVRKGIAELIGR